MSFHRDTEIRRRWDGFSALKSMVWYCSNATMRTLFATILVCRSCLHSVFIDVRLDSIPWSGCSSAKKFTSLLLPSTFYDQGITAPPRMSAAIRFVLPAVLCHVGLLQHQQLILHHWEGSSNSLASQTLLYSFDVGLPALPDRFPFPALARARLPRRLCIVKSGPVVGT